MSVNGSITKIASNRNLVNQDNATTPWVRNPLWMTMPDISSNSTQAIVALYRINNNDNNFLALQVNTNTGNYIVDWGDGVVESFGNGVQANHKYTYSSINDSATSNSSNASSLGYKQVIINITPSGASNLIGFYQDRKHTQSGLNNYVSKWLEIIINGPNINAGQIGGTTIKPTFLENVFIHRLANNAGANMTQLFRYCYSLQNINLFDTSSWTSFSSMFEFCTSLRTVPFFNTSNGTSFSQMFNSCHNLKTVPPFDTSKGTAFYYMFQSCFSLKQIPHFDTSLGTNMVGMFSNAVSLQKIPKLNTSNNTSFLNFCTGSNITSFPLLDTSKATNFVAMFHQCYNLKNIPLLDTSKGTDFSYFAFLAQGLVGVAPINTSSATNMTYMFAYTPAILSIPILNTSGVTNMSYMFQNCNSLISVSGLDTRSVNNFTGMFGGCSSLTNVSFINASSGVFGYSASANSTNTFNSCAALESLTISGVNNSINLANMCLSSGALNSIYSGLNSGVAGGTTIVVTNNYGATSSDTSIATSKGWTVVT